VARVSEYIDIGVAVLDWDCCCGDICTPFYCFPPSRETYEKLREKYPYSTVIRFANTCEQCNHYNNWFVIMAKDENTLKVFRDEFATLFMATIGEDCRYGGYDESEDCEECLVDCVEYEDGAALPSEPVDRGEDEMYALPEWDEAAERTRRRIATGDYAERDVVGEAMKLVCG